MLSDPSLLFTDIENHCSAPTEVVALENTLNGTIFPQEEIVAISDFAHSKGIKMHLDGARIWHVASETGTTIKELCDPFDSVSMCFSKGLGDVNALYYVQEDFIRVLITRCTYWLLPRRIEGFYHESKTHKEAVWWWDASDWNPGRLCCLCLDV